jgi:acetyl esterase/lipase
MVPVGHVMAALDVKIRKGTLPGIERFYARNMPYFIEARNDGSRKPAFNPDAFDPSAGVLNFYADGVHMNDQPHNGPKSGTIGSYVSAITHYATLSGESPVGLTVEPYEQFDAEADAELIKAIQETVWDIVAGHPYTGVRETSLFDAYCTVEDPLARYPIPEEGEPVQGTQKAWYTTPYDLRRGVFNMNCIHGLGTVSEEYVDVTPGCVVGRFTYRITPMEHPMPGANEVPDTKVISTDRVRFAQLGQVRDRNVLIHCRVSEVFPEGRGFMAHIQFAGEEIPCRVDVVTEEDVPRLPQIHSRLYGPNVKHSFDVYLPEGEGPFPMVINIHGGGWGALDKMNGRIGADADSWNARGIALVSANYRYLGEHQQHPAMAVPVAAPLLDAARAVQYVRYHAEEMKLDPDRISLTGGSAGGATSAWLAMHDDLADPESPDPVARMSTRVTCSTPHQAQTSLDPRQMREWIPEVTYGPGAFITGYPANVRTKEERFRFWLTHREEHLRSIRDFSAYEQASADDPPMLLVYGGQSDIPVPEGGNATHHPKFGEHLNQRLRALGVESYYWADNVRCDRERYHGWAGVKSFVQDNLVGRVAAE